MDNYIVSARKYRPATFRSVVGQAALTATLKNAIATGRLAHSYLFCGSRGVGKTTCARIFAKTINCEHPTPDGEACNECDSCRQFNAGQSLNIIELDAASNNGVDDIRALTDQVRIPPVNGRYRVFIIDEVHMLSQAAFNAFLKTLEEPPSYVVFILATTEKHKILPTILSRCQIYDFSRITIQDMIDHMKYVASQEGINVEEAGLNIIARKADGAMRDALSIFDQVAASTRGNITYQATLDNLNVLDYEYYNRLLDAFLAGDVMATWLIYKEIRERGFDSQFFINGLAAYFRDLAVARDPKTIVLLEAGDDARRAMAEAGAKCSPDFLLRAINLCNEADLNYRQSSGKQLLVELTLAKICQLLSPSPATADGKAQGLKKIAVNTAETTSTTPLDLPEPDIRKPETGKQKAESRTPITEIGTPKPEHGTRNPEPETRNPEHPVHPARGRRLSLRDLADDAKPSTPADASHPDAEPSAAAVADKPYTQEALINAWMAFAEARQTERILYNTMRASVPIKIEGHDKLTVTIENEHQGHTLAERLPEIKHYLSAELGNSAIELEIKINEGESSPSTWTDRQVLLYMAEGDHGEQFKRFAKLLDLKMR